MTSTTIKISRVLRHLGPTLAVIACFGLAVSPVAEASGGSSAPSIPSVPKAQETPEQNAARHYEMGLKHRDKAWKLEKKAAMEQGAAAEKLMNKAKKEFEKAVKAQRNAVTANPRMHEAYSSLGYALRKTGEFDEAVEAYDKALAISPTYTEAIEYRAEAYLALNRLEDVKNAYMTLLRADKARADELMTAMKKWLAQNADNDSGASEVSAADLEAFSTWVEERADIAGHAAMLVSQPGRGW